MRDPWVLCDVSAVCVSYALQTWLIKLWTVGRKRNETVYLRQFKEHTVNMLTICQAGDHISSPQWMSKIAPQASLSSTTT